MYLSTLVSFCIWKSVYPRERQGHELCIHLHFPGISGAGHHLPAHQLPLPLELSIWSDFKSGCFRLLFYTPCPPPPTALFSSPFYIFPGSQEAWRIVCRKQKEPSNPDIRLLSWAYSALHRNLCSHGIATQKR